MEKKSNLILTGRILPGHAREAAVGSLAKLVRLTDARASELLAGRETVIKRDLDAATLASYLKALQATGAEARVEEIAKPEAEAASAVAPVVLSPAPAAGAVKAVVETIKCPACGTEQPKRTLCRQCGANMPAIIAAKAEERMAPAVKSEPAAAERPNQWRESPLDRPFYRRSRLVEILFFIFITPLWSWFTMTDAGRGKKMRIAGGIVFAFCVLSLVLRVLSYSGMLEGTSAEELEVMEAAGYAFKVGQSVEQYAVANQHFPNRTASIELPEEKPRAVRTIAVGPEGRVQVTLGAHLKSSADGSIVLTPRVEEGVIHWRCEYEKVAVTREVAKIFKSCG